MGGAIEVEHIKKRYAGVDAVKGISFSVPRGEICGYLGPNGAGKSTTLKMLAGLLAPSEGTIRIAGHDIAGEPLAARGKLGFVPDDGALYTLLTPREHLALVADLHELDAGKAAARAVELFLLFELAGAADRRIDTLSKGQKQKVALACGLLHEPEVLLLDEPLNGLDVKAARALKDLLLQHAAKGGTVLLSSHILEVVERICQRTIIIDRGEVVADAPTAELIARSKDKSLESVFHQLVSTPAPAALREALAGEPRP